MAEKIFGEILSSETIDVLSAQDRIRLDDNKVKSVVPDTANQKLVVTYQDGTVVNIDMNTLVMNFNGGTFDGTTQILKLTSDDGGSDVTINLGAFVTDSELTTILQSAKPTGYSFTNNTTKKSVDINNMSLKDLGNVVATYIIDRQS